MSQFRLEGKVAIITGGASGLGLATAKAFLEAGILGLTLTDLSGDGLQRAFDGFGEHQSKIHLFIGSTSSEDDTKEYVSQTVARFGRLDISVQCAGIMQNRMAIQDTEMSDFDRLMEVNVRGAFLGMKYSTLAMLASPSQGKGCSIVVLSSQLGLDGGPGLSAYAATKFAVRGLVLSSAEDLGQYGIRVNAIAPGAINTPMLAHTPASMVPVIAGKTMLRRLGEPNEIADGILYLASDAAKYVTGTTLKVDGGYSKWA